ncbi:MAG: iron-containing alcohol dehydrogenase [Syntrophotaleaceae bacterium]
MDISKFVVPEIIFGTGALRHIGESAARIGASKVLVVSDAGLIEAGWVEKTLHFLNKAELKFVVFSSVSSNPKDFQVHEGLSLYHSSKCDGIIAVGGGSCADMAKAIAMLATNDGSLRSYEGINKICNPLPPMIVAPSTAGTGTEVTQFSRITDLERHLKMSFISKSLIPDIAVIDPDLLTTVTPQLAASTGMDALTHAIEAYVSLAATPLTNLHALNAIELIFANLRQAVSDRDDMKANSNMALASLNAGIAFSNAIFGAGHAMTHQVDGLLDTHHGETDAVLLPHVMEFNLPNCRRQFREMAAAMGEESLSGENLPDAEQAIQAVRRLAADIGLQHTLSDFGLTEELLPQLIENTMKDACLLTNPRAVTPNDLFDLFRRAL